MGLKAGPFLSVPKSAPGGGDGRAESGVPAGPCRPSGARAAQTAHGHSSPGVGLRSHPAHTYPWCWGVWMLCTQISLQGVELLCIPTPADNRVHSQPAPHSLWYWGVWLHTQQHPVVSGHVTTHGARLHHTKHPHLPQCQAAWLRTPASSCLHRAQPHMDPRVCMPLRCQGTHIHTSLRSCHVCTHVYDPKGVRAHAQTRPSSFGVQMVVSPRV